MSKPKGRFTESQVIQAWYDLAESDGPVSQREFCRRLDIPRSTFQRWLYNSYLAPQQYAPSTQRDTPEHIKVLRLLLSELKQVVSDIDEILGKL